MNYFELHVGDYQRKTAHLTLAEHGAYSLMLQAFYATEKPLPENRRILYRMLRVDGVRERKAVDSIVKQFWQRTEGGITNKRAEEVLAAYHNWLLKQRSNGSQGGRPPKPKHNPRVSVEETQTEPKHNPRVSPRETQTKPMGGYRARVPLPTPHLDHDLDTHTHTSRAAPNGSRSGRVGGTFQKAGSGWKPPTDEELGLTKEVDWMERHDDA